MFSYVLLMSYIVVVMWDKLSELNWKNFIGICLIVAIVCAYNFYNFSSAKLAFGRILCSHKNLFAGIDEGSAI